MKKQIHLICIICILLILVFIIIKNIVISKHEMSDLYKHYQYPNEDFFGKNLYAEIDYECSAFEANIANLILNKAVKVAEYTGKEEDCEAQLGDVSALNRYYYFNKKDAVKQNVSFDFITCKITEDKGHIWVASTVLRYDESGVYLPGGGKDILCLWYIEYQNDAWQVVRVQECP